MAEAAKPNKPMTVPAVRAAKGQRKLAMVTAYDYTSATLSERAGVELLLVGDSLGMVLQGHANPISVTLSEMVYHTRLVARAARRALVVADLPFGSYQASPAQAVRSAVRLLKAGAAAVKLEGGQARAATIAALVQAEIPVMAHVGLTPQSIHQLGGFRVQRDEDKLLEDAKAVATAGAFSVVVECVPTELALRVTQAIPIPTIGIGAGPVCDGQVLVFHDLLGLYDGFRPKFVKCYDELGTRAVAALEQYLHEVRTGQFPAAEHELH